MLHDTYLISSKVRSNYSHSSTRTPGTTPTAGRTNQATSVTPNRHTRRTDHPGTLRCRASLGSQSRSFQTIFPVPGRKPQDVCSRTSSASLHSPENMIAMTMMFWTYEYICIQPSGRIPRRGEQLTLCLCVLVEEAKFQDCRQHTRGSHSMS